MTVGDFYYGNTTNINCCTIGPFSSIADAATHANAEHGHGDAIMIAECVANDVPVPNAEVILEWIGEHLFDEYGNGCKWDENITEDQTRDLQVRLDKCFKEWAGANGIPTEIVCLEEVDSFYVGDADSEAAEKRK